MEIKLVNGSVYAVTRAEVTNGRLEIDFKGRTAEEVQNIFSSPAKLSNIELLTGDGEKFGELPGWTVYSGVTLLGDTVTVILTKEINSTVERITNAEARELSASETAESAKTLSENIASQVTDLQMAMCELYEERMV